MRVVSDVDLERDGKQVGSLRVPCSSDRSAWGSVLVPLVVVKRGAGPTALLVGGNHGDEYEGQLALSRLARELEPEAVQGRVILLPALNLPAALAGRRVSPLDGGNMNRAFPGDPGGGVTAMLAHYVDSVLLPRADYVLDLHSGGASLEFLPSAIMHRLEDPGQRRRTCAALEAFGAPLGLVLVELDSAGMLDTAAESRGKVFLSTELGGGGAVSQRTLEVARRGVRNVLVHAGILTGEPERPPEGTRLMQVPGDGAYVISPAAGLLEPLLELGAPVAAGQPVAEVVSVAEPALPPRTLTAGTDGVLFCRRFPARVERGDCVAVLARELGPADAAALRGEG